MTTDAVMKARSALSALNKARNYLPKRLLKLAYEAMVRSHLEYSSGVFAGLAETHSKKLETVQKIAARIISNAPRDAHAAPIIEALGLQSLHDRRKKHLLKLTNDILSCDTHPGLYDLMELNEKNEIEVSNARTRIGNRRFTITAAKVFNEP